MSKLVFALSLFFTLGISPQAMALRVERVGDGFRQPVWAIAAPGEAGTLYVVEQKGRVLRWDRATGRKEVFLDLRGQVEFGGEAGLLSLAFHPHYQKNGRYFVAYTARRDGEFALYLAERSSARNAEKELLHVVKPYTNHNGGLALFGPDGFLYLSVGDGGGANDPLLAGQDKDTLLGKLLRIDVDSEQPYGIPADNPFAQGGGRREIFAYGLRNLWRYSFDRKTGALFGGDVGQDRLEEVDLIEKGGNYGWNTMEGTRCFNPSANCDKKGLTLPLIDYPRTQGVSVTGGYVYRGTRLPELKGVYLYGDFGSGRIWGLKYDQGRRLVKGNELLVQSGLQISSFAEDQDGDVLIVAYTGEIYRFAR